MANDELYTPQWIFTQLNTEFDLDVASPKYNTTYVPAKHKYTIEDDGLTQPWEGLVWMNPPFSQPKPWVAKFLEHSNGIALLPLSGNAWWWQDMWQSDASVIMLRPSVWFANPEGEQKKIMYGVSLWGMGLGKEILQKSNIGTWR